MSIKRTAQIEFVNGDMDLIKVDGVPYIREAWAREFPQALSDLVTDAVALFRHMKEEAQGYLDHAETESKANVVKLRKLMAEL